MFTVITHSIRNKLLLAVFSASLLVAIALRAGLNPNDLKLVTALFVLAALVLPQLWRFRPQPAVLAPVPR